MYPREQYCHNQHCWAYGRKGEGHVVIHSQKRSATGARVADAPSPKRRAPPSSASISPKKSWSS
jgi:hypothetical protein